jgi:hypothetical protein
MISKLFPITLLTFVLTTLGCATVFSPSADQVSFTSDPEGAEVWLDGELVGHTPVIHRIDRQTFSTKRVTVRARGYESATFPLSKSFNKVAILNLTLWPSWITDALSGSMIEYAPRSYFVELAPRPVSPQSLALVEAAQAKETERALRREQTRYLLNNYSSIIKDLSRGHGEHLRNYWQLSSSDRYTYEEFLNRVSANSSELLAHSSPLELQRRLSAL